MSEVLDWIWDSIIDAITYVLDFLVGVDPFPELIASLDGSVLQTGFAWANYFMDLDFLLTCLAALLVALAVYYVGSIIMRWAKII